jgi:hypothetical protein
MGIDTYIIWSNTLGKNVFFTKISFFILMIVYLTRTNPSPEL